MISERSFEHWASAAALWLAVLATQDAINGSPPAQSAAGGTDVKAAPVPRELPLLARRERPLPGKPEGLCSGDFDGDGRIDLAATIVSPGALLVWHTAHDGLQQQYDSHPCGDFPLAPVALPQESFGAASGAQAIAVASRAARTLEIVAPAGRTLSLERTPRAIAAGMIGNRAMIAVACDGRQLELLRDGATEWERWSLSGDLPRCAFVSSALSAVLVGFQDSSAVEAYAAGATQPIGRIELGGIPRGMATIDVDGDGERELLIAGGDQELWVFGTGKGAGAGSWFERREPVVWIADAIPTSLAVADFDRDGRADLAVLSDFTLSLQILTRLSASGPERNPSNYAGQTPCGLAVLDVDADGKLDFAVGNRDTNGLGLLTGDGAGGLNIGTVIPLGSFPQALAAAPTTSPASALRLVALNVKSNSLSAVVFADGALRSLPEVPCGSEPRAPLIAELDGRPGLDVLFLVAGQHGADLRLFAGDRDGRLAPAATLELGGGASDLALLDVDGDGKSELAICDPDTATVMLLENSALRADASALTRAARLKVPSLPRDLTPIELDGDPALELACVLGASGERVGIAWLDATRNAAGELSLTELGYTALPGAPSEACACDLNGDGRMDLVVLATRAPDSAVGAWFALLHGPGGPADFTVSAPIATTLLPRGITAGDVDGDGRAEVFVAVQNSTLVLAWTAAAASGDGAFRARAFDSLGAGRGPMDLCVSDADGDGLPDLCVVNAFSNDVSVFTGTRN